MDWLNPSLGQPGIALWPTVCQGKTQRAWVKHKVKLILALEYINVIATQQIHSSSVGFEGSPHNCGNFMWKILILFYRGSAVFQNVHY